MSFDPYYTWLGIPPAEQPPNHYRLLGVQLFEPNDEVIANAADRQMTHVRSFQTGPHAAESQRLLTAIAAARVTLLDATKRPAYDAQLQATVGPGAVLATPTYVAPFPQSYAPAPTYSPYPAHHAPVYAPTPAPIYAPNMYAQPTPVAPPAFVAPPAAPPPSMPVPTLPPQAPVPVSSSASIPVPVAAASTAAREADVGEESAVAVRAPSLGRRARKSRDPLIEALKIVLGGAAGVGIGLAILSYFNKNPLSGGGEAVEESTQGLSDGVARVGGTTTRPTVSGAGATAADPASNVQDSNHPSVVEPERGGSGETGPPSQPTSSDTSDAAVTKSRGPGSTPTKSAGGSSQEPAVIESVTVEYRGAGDHSSGTFLRADLRLAQAASTPIPLADLTFRFWYKNPDKRLLQCFVDSPTVAAGRVTYRIITLDKPTPNVDEFCEISFTKDAGLFPPAPGSVELRLRLAASDDAPHDPAQDFSRLPAALEYAKTELISVYRGGKLIGGREPREFAGLQITVAGIAPPNFAGRLLVSPAEPPPEPKRTKPTREPREIPSSEQLAEAAKQVDTVFPPSTKRTFKEKRELARRMRAAALESDDQPAEQYLLFRRLAETAQETGDAKLVAEAIERMAERFTIDAPLVRQRLLVRTMDAINEEAALKDAVEVSRDTLFDLVLAGRYDEALQLAEKCDELCHKPFGKSFRKSVADGRHAIRALHVRWQDFVKARAKLAADADDANSNYVVGRWFCCQEDRWPEGLAALVKCSDAKLAELARADLAVEQQSGEALHAARLAAADGWYDASTISPVYKEFAPRALDLYEQLAPQVNGLTRAKVDMRMKELRTSIGEHDQASLAWRALRSRVRGPKVERK